MPEHTKPVDVAMEVAKISAQLSWMADLLQANDDDPGLDLFLKSLSKQLAALLEPLERMQEV